MSKVRDIVFEGEKFWGPGVSPPLSLPDVSRWGNNGVFTNVIWVRQPSGLWAMSFNGTTSLVDCGNDASLLNFSARSVLAWVKPTAALAAGFILDSGYWTGNGSHMFITATGVLVVTMQNAGEDSNLAGETLTVSTWAQVGLTWDGTTLKSVYNGVVNVATTPHAGAITSGANLIIGRRADDASEYWKGFIALSRIYNCFLSASQTRQRDEVKRPLFFGVN